MPEVLILCEYSTLNGGERSMLATLEGVRAAGFSPVVVAPPDGPLAEELSARRIESIPFCCRKPDGTRMSQERLREELAAVLRRRSPSLLHANSLAMGRLSGPVAAELALPSVSHLRDIVKLSSRAVADLNCHRRLLAVSRATLDFHVAGGVSPEKTHVVYNGVDLDEFRPRSDEMPTENVGWDKLAQSHQKTAKRAWWDCASLSHPTTYLHREFDLPIGAPLIATIGQIGLRKGQDTLLQAAETVAARLPNVHWLIVGERNSEKEESWQFERQLHLDSGEGGLCGRVHFLGRRNDIPRLLGELTLLVHPARQEPLGRVLLEAAAAGLAVVATDVGGTREIFPEASCSARLVPADDAPALAAAMLELLGDGALRGRMGAAARGQVEERFDSRRAAVNLVRHYQAVLE